MSPVKYEDYTCGQIAREAREVDRQSEYLRKYLRHEATADKWQMGVGLAVTWPALLFLEGGDGPEATSYANLKGEKIALEKIADDKKCGVLYQASRG